MKTSSRTSLLSLPILVSTLLLSFPSSADLVSAKQAISDGNGELAIMELSRLAGMGNSEAQYELGKLYATGKLVPEDPNRAMLALTLAVENGFRMAESLLSKQQQKINRMQLAALQEQLGTLFQEGGPVTIDPNRATSWLAERILNPVPFTNEERGEMARKVGKIYEEKIFSFTAAHTWYTLAEAFGTERAKKDRQRMELFLQDKSVSQSRNDAIEKYKNYLRNHKKMVDGKL